MSKPKVVVTRRWPEACEAALHDAFDVTLNAADAPFSRDQYQDALRSADALFCTVTDRIDADLLAVDSPRAKLLGNYGVGFNNIDIAAAAAAGYTVTNTPEVLTNCTADLAMTLLLSAARRAGEGERLLRAGRWDGWCPTHHLGIQVSGKTLGIIGMGRIGVAAARRAHHGFGMKIIYYSVPAPDAALIDGLDATAMDSVEALLGDADFVSLHCPSTPETHKLMNAERLRQMKPNAVLINTARGDVVDEPALIDALRERRIAAAGLDVFANEPDVPSALAKLENVVLLPHLGSATEETRVAMGMRVLRNAQAFFAGETPPDKVV